MGNWLHKIHTYFKKSEKQKILLLGLDGAGKTTLLYKLKLAEYVATVPTIGFNVEEVKYHNMTMTVWDIGGQKKIRDLWRHYYMGTDGIIFIVDITDDERYDLVKEEISYLLLHDDLAEVPILIMANKIDIGTKSIKEQHKYVPQIEGRYSCVIGTCALSGEGISSGLEWLMGVIKKREK